MSKTPNIITDPDRIIALFPKAEGISYPPNCFVEMGAEFQEYVEGESLLVRFPVQEKYQNPLAFMQGGFLLAAIDNTIGPLSYMVAPPSVTTTLNATYLRPVPPQMTHFYVLGRVVEVSRTLVHLEAEAFAENKKALLKVTSSSMVLPQYQRHTQAPPK